MDKPTQRIRNWSETAASNNATPPYGWPEGQAPSTVNDCARQMMSDLRYQFEDSEWFCWGDVPSRASAATFKIAADVTSRYLANRRLKVYDGSTYYATIVSATYSAPDTTITLSMDSGSLTASLTSIALSILSPTNSAIPETQNANDAYPCMGRLTLTTVTPVTTADVTAATNIYFTPYMGNSIALYDGSATWSLFTFAELTLGITATTSTMHDVFAYNNAGVVALEALAWTNDTTRATALVKQDGVLVKSGATTRRYIGSYRTTTASGQTEDSYAKRYVYNYYNRVKRPMYAIESTATWNYSTASFRQANGATTNQLDFIVGFSEDSVFASVMVKAFTSTATVRTCTVGIGLDSTTVNSARIYEGIAVNNVSQNAPIIAQYENTIAVGRHTLVWLEQGAGTDTQTWVGTTNGQSGILGFMWG